jgi:cyclophilin family peptidyl-prolyl cis-trans isomerase
MNAAPGNEVRKDHGLSSPNVPPSGQQPPYGLPPHPYYPPLGPMAYAPPPQPQRRGLQWWHWLLIASGGMIAICCVMSVALIALSTIAASRTTDLPPSDMTPSVSSTGQATCNLVTHQCTGAPLMTINTADTYIATIMTEKGDIVIQLDAKNAPIAVNNFVFLAQSKWYDGTYFWRVETPGKPSVVDPTGGPSSLSLVQGGSVAPDGSDGNDTPGYTIQDDDPLPADYSAGTISMASAGLADSASAQFFITTADESQYFSKTYVTFGKVTQGMDVLKKVTADDMIETIIISMAAG